MSAIDTFNEMTKVFDRIKENIDAAPEGITCQVPSCPDLTPDQFIGRKIREFIVEVRRWINSVNENKTIQSETRGLSGTKNEMLRDLVIRLNDLMLLMIRQFDDLIDILIETKFANEPVTQQEINKMIGIDRFDRADSAYRDQIVVDNEVDKVALFKLRKFTKSKPEANYYEYTRTQKALLFGTKLQKLGVGLDRFHLIPKSTKTIDQIWPGQKTKDDLIALLDPVKYDKNVIIIKYNKPGYIFGTIDPKPDDVTKAINSDFIHRTRVVNEVKETSDKEHIVCLPKKGALVSVYETYNYESFQFMSTGLDKNLVPWSQAIGYFSARTGNILDETPVTCQVGYNDIINKTFAENYYRHDLVLMASEFKFGQGLADAIKHKIKDLLLDDAEDYSTLDVKSIILRAVNETVSSDISRESSISSYLGLIRLSEEFSKEYRLAIKDVHWDTHKKIAMVDVFNRCSAKCDKLNAWSVDFRSPKDLFWK